ncbi:hypothetical protein LguiA_007645 [Lonicera macranthoides]
MNHCNNLVYLQFFLSLGFRASPVDKKSAAVFFSVGTESRSKSDSVLEKETIKIPEEDRVLRWRKQIIKGEDHATLSLDNDSTYNKQGYLPVIVLPFLLHFGFMSATAFFVMHVQVLTQFLSSSPPLCWFASYAMAWDTMALHGLMKSKLGGLQSAE